MSQLDLDHEWTSMHQRKEMSPPLCSEENPFICSTWDIQQTLQKSQTCQKIQKNYDRPQVGRLPNSWPNGAQKWSSRQMCPFLMSAEACSY
ncbi:hypothetical protein COCON_G00163520 [Conger conger]|uniref:Uncharacterized protein n=1 Tax=Conger conger TaxID=82655 RepID=A0A9Q1HT07_CONCO|nr:hypothetical protein COCON_G00163520 [Conger conger]